MSLTFDPVQHEYRFAGEVVPSVTQVLKPLTDYSRIPADTLETARQQGVAIHKMVELDCMGDLDEDGLPEWMRPYFLAWRAFVDESGFVVVASEQRVYHPALRYAGTLDLMGYMPKLKGGDALGLIDVKRSFYADAAIGYQTAAYALAWNVTGAKPGPCKRRFALRLDPTGRYRLREFANAQDTSVFTACLVVHRARESMQ